MASRKEALRSSRQLLRACTHNGHLQQDRVRQVLSLMVEKKPRNYSAILDSFQRSVRLELDKRHAIIESAQSLSDEMQSTVHADLKKKYGDDVTVEYKTNPELLGGMRVKIGSDVWDGTVRARLKMLEEKFA